MMKEIVKGVRAFCSYLFVPQWGSHKKYAKDSLE